MNIVKNRIWLFISFLVLLQAYDVGYGQNLINNPDFEEGLSNWNPWHFPTGWTTDNSNPASGNYSLIFSFPNGAGYYDAAIRSYESLMPIELNRQYLISFWLREKDTHDTYEQETTILDLVLLIDGEICQCLPASFPTTQFEQWTYHEAIVEFDDEGHVQIEIQIHGYATSENPEFSIDNIFLGQYINNNIFIPPIQTCLTESVLEYGLAVPIYYNSQTTTAGLQLPFSWDNPFITLDSVSFINTALETWTGNYTIDNINRTLCLGYADLNGDVIQAGMDTVLARLYFSVSCTPGHTGDSVYINFSTTNPNCDDLLFADDSQPAVGFTPTVAFEDILIEDYVPGDFNNDCLINILDIVNLINYKFKGGPAPIPYRSGDVNGDCEINILDIVYLVNYKFKGGPAPVCGCAVEGEEGIYKQFAGKTSGELVSQINSDITTLTISTSVPISGLEMILKSLDGKPIEITRHPNGMEVYYNQVGQTITLGLLDLTGNISIGPEDHELLTIKGNIEVVEVLGADEEAQAVHLNIVNRNADNSNLPTDFALEQNYPNPFNPVTEISFSLPVASDVKLDVYNIMGQKVASLAEGQFEAGRHSIKWDASTSASGIYFYRIKAGEFVESRKMLLLK